MGGMDYGQMILGFVITHMKENISSKLCVVIGQELLWKISTNRGEILFQMML